MGGVGGSIVFADDRIGSIGNEQKEEEEDAESMIRLILEKKKKKKKKIKNKKVIKGVTFCCKRKKG